MNALGFKAQLKSGLCGAYIFFGEEEYLKRYYLREARKSIVTDKALDAFNRCELYAENATPANITGAISSLPMLADKKLVEICGVDFGSLSQTALDEFNEALEGIKEHPETVAIIYCGEDELDPGQLPNRPSKCYTELTKVCAPVYFERETEAKLVRWVVSHFGADKVACSPETASALIGLTGRDMYRLSCEIEKLSAYALSHGKSGIEPGDFEGIVSKVTEIGAFDFANSVLEGDTERAFAILDDMKSKREKPELILAGISRVYADLCAVRALYDGGCDKSAIAKTLKMHEYKCGMYLRVAVRRDEKTLRRILREITAVDAEIKSTASDSYMQIDRLAAKIGYLLKAKNAGEGQN